MIAVAAAFLVALAPVVAPSAAHGPGPIEATAEDVHAALVGASRAVVIDSRSAQEYEQGHVPGALSIPAERTKVEAVRLPRDRATPLIFYCRGPG